jgi:hypothetical protein
MVELAMSSTARISGDDFNVLPEILSEILADLFQRDSEDLAHGRIMS